jgi:hypothetical protein
MPAKSKKQQMAAGAALAAKQGKRKKSSLKMSQCRKSNCEIWQRQNGKSFRMKKILRLEGSENDVRNIYRITLFKEV